MLFLSTRSTDFCLIMNSLHVCRCRSNLGAREIWHRIVPHRIVSCRIVPYCTSTHTHTRYWPLTLGNGHCIGHGHGHGLGHGPYRAKFHGPPPGPIAPRTERNRENIIQKSKFIKQIRFCTTWELRGPDMVQNTPTRSGNHFHISSTFPRTCAGIAIGLGGVI